MEAVNTASTLATDENLFGYDYRLLTLYLQLSIFWPKLFGYSAFGFLVEK